MLNVYFENRRITVCSHHEPLLTDPDTMVVNTSNPEEIASLPEYFDRNRGIRSLIIPSDDEQATASLLFSQMRQIKAGGGLVTNPSGEYLLILRGGLWDLPKGKLEPDELIHECALREVEEETGLAPLSLGELVCVTHHTYHMFGEFCVKHSWWYRMSFSGDAAPTPQREEDITNVAWVKEKFLPEHLAGTYPSITEVFRKAGIVI